MSEKHRLLDAGAIVGIGATEFSKKSGRSDLQLAIEACEAAIDDAGLKPAQVDGMVTSPALMISSASRRPLKRTTQ